MGRVIGSVVLVLISACASDLTPEERAWREAMDFENWQLCMAVYDHHHRATVHADHVGHHHRPGHWSIANDLGTNKCRRLLGEYWAE